MFLPEDIIREAAGRYESETIAKALYNADNGKRDSRLVKLVSIVTGTWYDGSSLRLCIARDR
jgi:hypothetical protein